MLQKRVAAAAVMIAGLTGAMWLDLFVFKDSRMLHLLFLLGAYFSYREFWPMCRATGHQTFSQWGTHSGCALVVIHYYSMNLATAGTFAELQRGVNLLWAGMAVSILGAFVLTVRRNKFEASIGGVAVTCFGLLYIFFLPSFVLKIRHLGNNGSIGGPEWNLFGHKMVVATIVLAKGCDVWAYLVGRMVGRHKAFPNLSPGKTIEGVIAGLVGTALTAIVLNLEYLNILPKEQFNLVKSMIFGVCVGFGGMMGDLAESLLKRSAGAKDASQIVPGYGGAMDVVDSLMVAGPVAYFLISAIL